jgi:hypothetical protein
LWHLDAEGREDIIDVEREKRMKKDSMAEDMYVHQI